MKKKTMLKDMVVKMAKKNWKVKKSTSKPMARKTMRNNKKKL